MCTSLLLSGNEALARGAWEAGVRVGAGYPGTPSTEILEALARYEGVYCEWSTNEKVALEVAAGAALAGARALATMKHVGLNVAADPLFSAAYMGVNGGLVIVSADDPGMHSSQNELDNRLFAAAARVPLIEPATPQECLSYVRLAFALSERFDTPVLLRTTTTLSHGRAAVEVGEPERVVQRGYRKDVVKNVVLPAHARIRHRLIEESRMPALAEAAEAWVERLDGKSDVAVITAGVASLHAREAFPDADVLKLGMTYPLPERAIREFARGRSVLVVEELEPFLEQQIRALGIDCMQRTWPRYGELSPRRLRAAVTGTGPAHAQPKRRLPVRPPLLCPGCSHRATFHALGRLGAIVTGDIGCYTLGALPPLDAMDSCMNMGASIGMAHGFEKGAGAGERRPVVAVIGDSTFFHSGITGLLDVVYNQGNATVVVLDNRSTAMTGHQGHPGTGERLDDSRTAAVDIAAIARAVGVRDVRVLDPYDLDATYRELATAVDRREPSVLIPSAPCVLKERLTLGEPVTLNAQQCTDCHACVRVGCPAIELVAGRLAINALLCAGCTHCQQLCADCNAGLDVGHVLELMEHDRFAEAVDAVLRVNPLPATVARVCPHPCDHAVNALGWPQAEQRVRRYPRLLERFPNADNSAISVRAIEQWLGDYALANPPAACAAPAEQARTVAVIGSGPAGLSAAWQLRRSGCRVSVIEAAREAGGMLRHGIPGFRLAREVLDAELARLQAAGVAFEFNRPIRNAADFEAVRASYDAVILAVGDSRAKALRVATTEAVAERVLTGLDFLERYNAGQPAKVGERVAVIGGGNTAVDCARAAVRLGARATVVYRRTEAEMPAIPDEVEEARREGVVFEFQRAPLRLVGTERIELVTLETRQDGQHRGRLQEVAGTERSTRFDVVIAAVGEEADVEFLKGSSVATDGHIIAAFAGATSAPGVFACGDAAFGYGTVGQAIASGRKTADAVSQYLEQG